MSAQMIEEAVLAAIEFFERLYQDKGMVDVLLEEVREKSDVEWEVTIGYSRLIRSAPPIKLLTEGQTYAREYKVLTVDKQTGRVVSMTMMQAV